MRALLVAALALCAAALAAHLLVPFLIEDFVARDLQNAFGLSSTPEVDLDAGPFPGALAGRFEGGRVRLVGPELPGGVRPDSVTVDLAPFDVDVLESITSGRLRGEGPTGGLLSVELSEGEVARIASDLAEAVPSAAPVTGVELGDGYIDVESELNLFGARVPVGVEGGLALRDSELSFEPRRLEAFGAPVPDGLAGGLLETASFSYPVDELLPFEGTLSNVEVREDRLVLSGEATVPSG